MVRMRDLTLSHLDYLGGGVVAPGLPPLSTCCAGWFGVTVVVVAVGAAGDKVEVASVSIDAASGAARSESLLPQAARQSTAAVLKAIVSILFMSFSLGKPTVEHPRRCGWWT